MNENESVEAEPGSETSLDSKSSIKKNTLTTQKPSSRKRNRCKYQKCKLREYPILEAVFFLILVILLITCYWIISQNQETHRMILSLQSQLNSVQKHIGKDFMNTKDEAERGNKNETEKTKETLEEGFKEIRMEPNVRLEQSQRIQNITSKPKETCVSSRIPTASINPTVKQYNAASLIADATIDKSLSSISSLNPLIGFDQSSLVLVDRPEPPPNKAWCTYDKNPVLTVKLGYYIKPTAVSYQHSKWNETIPDDAPEMYSVEACLDGNCISRKPLFSNCEYNSHGLQEQTCNNTSYDSIKSPIAKLQFRFHKNHGNTERTCVSLVRVYSEYDLVKEKNLKRLEDTTTCLNLNHHYHNNPMIYKFYSFKSCALLYSKKCCQECPECCDECEIKDLNLGVTLTIVYIVILVSIVIYYNFKKLFLKCF